MNQPTSPGKTLTTLQVLGAEMSAIVGAEPKAALGSAVHQVGPLFVALNRYGRDWSLTLTDETPISDETCAEWAAAVGAPAVEWMSTANKMCRRCEWEGVGEDAPAVREFPLFGVSPARR